MLTNVKIELCANGIEDVITALNCPFDSIELNSGTEVDGLTPQMSVFLKAKEITDKKIYAMIRPRSGGFCYSESEYELMLKDARSFLENGADGIVFGFTEADGKISAERTAEFIKLIHSFNRTAIFHKAIDIITDKKEALTVLNTLEIDEILTSPENAEQFRELGFRKEIKAGGGIRSENVIELIESHKLNSIHFSAKKVISDSFGSYNSADCEEIHKIISAIRNHKG